MVVTQAGSPPLKEADAPSAPEQPTPKAGATLDRSFARSIAWTGAAKWTGQLVSWGSTIFVARILTPDDYGVVAMANIFIGLTAMVSEFGIGSAVVALPTLAGNRVKQLNAFAFMLGVTCFALACLSAIPLSLFFNAPELRQVTVVLGSAFIFSGLSTVPDALLQKDHRFRRLALLDVAQSIALAAMALTLAMLGFGYWTLVLSTVFGRALSAALAMKARPTGFAWPRINELREALTFGSHLVVSRLSWFAYSNADFLIAGKLLGKSALGFYTIAWDIASAPVGKISTLLMRVTPAYFAALRDQPEQLRRYLLMTTGSLAILTFPASLGLFIVAPDFVTVAVGEKWRGAVHPMQMIALYASFRSITPLVTTMLASIGETRLTMRNSIMASIFLPISFIIGSRWGVTGVATAWIIAHPIVLIPLYRKLFQRINLKMIDYIRALKPPLVGCAGMLVVVPLMRMATPDGWPVGARLAIECVSGAAVYGGTLYLLYRDELRAIKTMFRG